MGSIPGLGFKTNVKDEEFAREIAEKVAEVFDELEYDENRDALSVNGFDGHINYSVLDGGYNEYVGMRNDGLVFYYKPRNWPNWDEYSNKGDLMRSVRNFVDDEFEYVTVEELMPIIPTT